MFQLQGGKPPDQGLCPWTPLGAEPPDPSYSARHGAGPPKKFQARTATALGHASETEL